MILPYNELNTSKKEQVSLMFNNIAHRYDFLNHYLSLGIDRLWRRGVVKELKPLKPAYILDVATGTGDLAIAIAKLKPTKIIGIDISPLMLQAGRQKVEKLGLSSIIELKDGDSESIQFQTNTFDAVTVAFGVRNYENLMDGLKEMHRVLKPKGKLVVLEFSKPNNLFIKWLYFFYFTKILPKIGRLFSKDVRAYTYLPESVNSFPYGDQFLEKLKETGFSELKQRRLTFGISSIYSGVK